MSYVLSSQPTFTVPVTIKEPGDDPTGKSKEQSFVARFKWLDEDQAGALAREKKGSIRDFVKEVFVGWYGIVDATGAEVPFSESMRDLLLKRTHFILQLSAAYQDAYAGVPAKN